MTEPTTPQPDDDEHVCKPGATVYYCPTAGETESDCHGGFDVCCARPEEHQQLVTCSLVVLHQPHGPHPWEPQPGAPKVYCVGSGATSDAGRMLGHIAKKLNTERAAHEEHRRTLADALGPGTVLGISADADWATILLRATQVARRVATWRTRTVEAEAERDRLAGLLDAEQRQLAEVDARCDLLTADLAEAKRRAERADRVKRSAAGEAEQALRHWLTAEATLARVRDWIAGEPVTGRNEFGNGYREALRDLTDVMNGTAALDGDQPAEAQPAPGDWVRNAADHLLNAASVLRDAAHALTDPS